jgi:hypothetical protein
MTELPSWAAWRRSHGFGVLCIRSGEGEHFVIVTGDLEAHATPNGHRSEKRRCALALPAMVALWTRSMRALTSPVNGQRR